MPRPTSCARARRLLLVLIAGAALLVAVAHVPAAGAAARPVRPTLQPRTLPTKLWDQDPGLGHSAVVVNVKFAEGSGVRVRAGHLVSNTFGHIPSLDAVLARYPGVRATPLFGAGVARLETLQHQREIRSGRQLADLTLFFQLRVPQGTNISTFADALNALPMVESAQLAPTPTAPPTTPNYIPNQGYRIAATSSGIDADYAATVPGGTGGNVHLIDVEYSWNRKHEDLAALRAAGSDIHVGTPVDPFSDNDHGTAVIGEIASTANGFGVTGLAPDVSLATVNADSVEHGFNVARGVLTASQHLAAGDVMLIEQQVAGPGGDCEVDQLGCVPVEWDTATYNAIVSATAAGIIVVEAAGNGEQDLDSAIYGTRFPQGQADSGAIIVGAGNGKGCTTWGAFPARKRLPFSNYGTRVDVQGWGDCIYSTGYGDLQNLTNATYTSSFGGTSGAAPMIASAAADLSSVAKEQGKTLTPAQVRSLLVSTGTAQPSADTAHIGPLPNLKAAILGLTSSTPVVAKPQHYVRTGALLGTVVPVREFWTANDPNGITDYAVSEQVDGGSWTQLSLPSATSTSIKRALSVGHTYRFRVRARNGNGAWSGYAYDAAFVPRVNQENQNVTYSSGWTRSASAPASGGHVEVSGTAGSWARFGFHGRNVAWVATSGANFGQAFVYLDGVYTETVNLHSTSTVARKLVRSYYWPTAGNHRIKVVVVGTAGHPAVDVDAFAAT